MPIQSEKIRGKVRTQLPTAQRSAERLPLPENRPFKLWIDPLRVWMFEGDVIYNPIEIPIGPGLHNTPQSGDSTHLDALQRKLERVEVPGDMTIEAHGETHSGYLVELEIGEDANGKTMTHYHSVFIAYSRVGRNLVPKFDRAAWVKFCRQCEDLVGGPPDEAIADGERDRMRSLVAQHQRVAHSSPTAAGAIAHLEAAMAKPKTGRAATT